MKTGSLGVSAAWCSEFLGTKLLSCHVIVDPFRNLASQKKLKLRPCGRAETTMSASLRRQQVYENTKQVKLSKLHL